MLKTFQKKQVFCPHPFNRIKVDPAGYATMCCFHQRRCLGNILDSGFESVWNSPLAQEIRAATLENKLHPTCASETCPYIELEKDLHKQIHHEVRITEASPAPLPRTLEVDLPTQWCNIGGLKPTKENPACIMCERHTRFQEQEDRLRDVCKLLSKYKFDTIHIQGVAEPFWRDRVFEVVDDLGIWPNKDTIQVTSTTNGTVLTENRIKKWLELPHTSMTFSIDASIPETYIRIRRIDAYFKIVKALKQYSELRDPSRQFLRIHNNINLINVNEVIGMVALAAEANVDSLEFNPTYRTPGICVNEHNFHLFKKAEEQILETAAELNVNVTFLRKLTLNYCDEPNLIQLG